MIVVCYGVYSNIFSCTVSNAAASCPPNIELMGDDEITQGQFGAFVCEITEFGILWNFGSEHLEFIGSREVGDVEPRAPLPDTMTFARLLMRNITDNSTNQGIRTSVLHFEPYPDFIGSINISCRGISPTSNPCIKTVRVIATGEHF